LGVTNALEDLEENPNADVKLVTSTGHSMPNYCLNSEVKVCSYLVCDEHNISERFHYLHTHTKITRLQEVPDIEDYTKP
jgi:hypothetical protein